ncbi:MAG: SPOR domain-containing protein [Treponema sp.]|nr:SPOR domain-containing protein [Treponema sp.]MCL2271333.1 SPOR domain-containing protein [Treponema sp.]
MKYRIFITLNLLLLAGFCYAQQNIPSKIIGRIPDLNSAKLYLIQVGAFKVLQNADNAASRLRKEGVNPVYEKYNDLTRVMVSGLQANQIRNYLALIKKAGFDEVIIREERIPYEIPETTVAATSSVSALNDNSAADEKSGNSLSEKWEITTPGSNFSSFEFNKDNNFIAVENSDSGEESKKLVHFGEYTMPSEDTINLENLGVIKFAKNEEQQVNLSFSPADGSGKSVNLDGQKAEQVAASPEADLFCRTWVVVNCTVPDYNGYVLMISNSGTYFFTTPDGKANSLSQWRWHDEKKEEFDFSHDNWEHFGKVQIENLEENSLIFFDPGYFEDIAGFSAAELNYTWELAPVSK